GGGFVVVVVVVVDCCCTCGAGVDVVVVLCVCEGCGCCVVVVEVVDCVLLCAITGRDSANTISAPRTTASRFLDFIRFSFASLATLNRMAPPATESSLSTIARSQKRIPDS